MDDQEKSNLSKISIEINSSVRRYVETFYQEMKRKFYLTPSNFLDYLQLFVKLYGEEQISLPKKISKYENGLQKME